MCKTVCLVLLLTVSFGSCFFVGNAQSTVLFSDNFNNGFTEWTGTVTQGSNILEVVDNQVHVKAVDNTNAYAHLDVGSQDVLFTQFEVTVNTYNGWNPTIIKHSANGHTVSKLTLNGPTSDGFNLRIVGLSGSVYSQNFVTVNLKDGVSYVLTLATSIDSSQGFHRLFVDGVEVSSIVNVDTSVYGLITQTAVGAVDVYLRPFEYSFDNVVVSTEQQSSTEPEEPTQEPEIEPELLAASYKISVDQTQLNKYSLTYPITYEFTFPEDLVNLKIFKRYEESAWSQLTEKTSSDFFNGIECVRFDYSTNKAYVSLVFNEGNIVYVKAVDDNGNVSLGYVGTSKYYDDRKAAVFATGDDILGASIDVQVSQIFQENKVWLTYGIITNRSTTNWASLQTMLDNGFLEYASHSRNHPGVPYSDYDSEIGGSKQDILSNLSQDSVVLWIEPAGQSDDMVRAKLAEYDYLLSRWVSGDTPDFVEWNSQEQLFDRVGANSMDGISDAQTLNSRFDSRYVSGQIYGMYFHPLSIDLGVVDSHLGYVGGRTDVWYAGLGDIYKYRYVTSVLDLTVVNSSDSTTPTIPEEPEPTNSSMKTFYKVESNSTVEMVNFQSNYGVLDIRVSGPSGTVGCTNVTVSKQVMVSLDSLDVYLDNSPLGYTVSSDNESWYVCFSYGHSTHLIQLNFGYSSADSFSSDPWIVVWVVGAVIGFFSLLVFFVKKWKLLGGNE